MFILDFPFHGWDWVRHVPLGICFFERARESGIDFHLCAQMSRSQIRKVAFAFLVNVDIEFCRFRSHNK